MQHGTIKNWNGDRGYGFIRPDVGEADVFVHITAVESQVDELKPGQRVTFDIGRDGRTGKTCAQSVALIVG